MPWRILVSAPYFLPVVEDYRSQLETAGLELVLADVSERLSEEAACYCMRQYTVQSAATTNSRNEFSRPRATEGYFKMGHRYRFH